MAMRMRMWLDSHPASQQQSLAGHALTTYKGWRLDDNRGLNYLPFRPDSWHTPKGSSTGLGTGFCLTRIDTLNC